MEGGDGGPTDRERCYILEYQPWSELVGKELPPCMDTVDHHLFSALQFFASAYIHAVQMHHVPGETPLYELGDVECGHPINAYLKMFGPTQTRFLDERSYHNPHLTWLTFRLQSTSLETREVVAKALRSDNYGPLGIGAWVLHGLNEIKDYYEPGIYTAADRLAYIKSPCGQTFFSMQSPDVRQRFAEGWETGYAVCQILSDACDWLRHSREYRNQRYPQIEQWVANCAWHTHKAEHASSPHVRSMVIKCLKLNDPDDPRLEDESLSRERDPPFFIRPPDRDDAFGDDRKTKAYVHMPANARRTVTMSYDAEPVLNVRAEEVNRVGTVVNPFFQGFWETEKK